MYHSLKHIHCSLGSDYIPQREREQTAKNIDSPQPSIPPNNILFFQDIPDDKIENRRNAIQSEGDDNDANPYNISEFFNENLVTM